MQLTELGAKVAQQGPEERRRVLDQLCNDAEISDYMKGVCYDTVAFCLFLGGKDISVEQLLNTNGQAWLGIFNFDAGTAWRGEEISRGSGVGFKRVGDYSPGYFHAAVAVGGTDVRGVNANYLTPGWSAVFDLAKISTDKAGVYQHDNQPIEVRYV